MELSRDFCLKFSPYLEILTGVRAALTVNEGIIKIVGPEGTGKSTLCRRLVSELENGPQDVIFFETPPESVEYLHKRIQSQLGLDKGRSFNRTLTQYLMAKPSPGNKLVVIYDDAEKIDKEIFILIRLLNNIHNDSETLVSQIICGTKKLDKLFDDPDLRSLTQYLNQSFTLAPMTRDELEDLYSGFIKELAVNGKSLNNKQLTEIFKVSRGLPDKTLELLEEALLEKQSPENATPESGNDEAITSGEQLASTGPGKSGIQKHLWVENGIHAATELTYHGKEIESWHAMAETSASYTPDDNISDAQEYEEQDSEVPQQPAGSQKIRPVTVKIVLSMLVLVAAVVLAFVLIGDNSRVNDRLDEVTRITAPPALLIGDLAGNVENENDVNLQNVNNTVPAEISVESVDFPVTNELEGFQDQSTELLLDDTEQSRAVEAELLQDNPPLVAQDTGEAAVDLANGEIEVPTGSAREQVPQVTITTPAVGEDARTPQEKAPLDNAETTVNERSTATVSIISREQTLRDAINRWADAWEQGDFPGYLAVYDEDFYPANQDSREAWETLRRARIVGVDGISTEVDRFEIMEEPGSEGAQGSQANEVTVRFWLSYSRSDYSDETLKELQLRLTNGTWVIFSERNLEIITGGN